MRADEAVFSRPEAHGDTVERVDRPRSSSCTDPLRRLSLDEIEVREDEGNLLEWSELVVVAQRFAPIAMNGRDQYFGVMHTERVNFGSVGLAKTRTAETASRVLMQRAVTISKIKSTPQNADDIVIGLFAPPLSV